MVGLIVLGLCIPKAVQEFKSFDRTVNVKGLCEKEVKADKVIWPLAFKTSGNDLNAVYAEIDRNNTKIKDFLKQGGISENEITVSAPSISDKYATEYGTNDRVYRYLATSIITVCTNEVDKVMALMSKQADLMRGGIPLYSDWETRSTFSFESLNDIKPAMIEEATKNAREVAIKFAKDSESKLGKIKSANQGTFSIEDRDSNTPSIKKVRVVTNVTYYLTK